MKKAALLCAFILGIAGTLTAQTASLNIFDLKGAYFDALKNNAPIEERRKIAAQFKTYLQTDNDETLFKYTYIGDLLKGSDDPKDVQEAVWAYDYFLRNTRKHGYNFPDDYPEQEHTLALLLISKYYYYTLTGELPFDVRYTVAEAVRWFEGPLDKTAQLETAAKNIMALQQWKLPGGNPQAYAATMEVVRRYSGLFLCDLGEVIKYNNKKQAKKWYNQAQDLGYAEAKTHMANIDQVKYKGVEAYGYPSANYKEQRLSKEDMGYRVSTDKSYDEWWEKTYGKGGTQSGTTMPNNNIPQSSYKTGSTSEADRHQRMMDQIYYDTKKQMERSFKN